jgi:processive 1,2-diacylglycerol beta-glucosyltransferase
VGDRLRRAWEILNLQPFLEYLKSEPWDVVVNTHFLPAEMIATLKRKRRFGKPQVTVTTDFETHRLWVNEPTDLYTTATEEGKRNLESWGIKPERIAVTGIPIDPVFSDEKDRGAVLRKHGIKGDRPVVLQLAGGFGVGPIEKIYTAIQEVNRPLDIVIVCGKNARAKERVEQVPCVPRHRCKTLGFTTEMDELMCAADVVVSKPGGLTTSEALARGCAMMIVNPIPGQESRNSDFLLENGAAQKANSLSVLGYKLSRLLETSGRLEALKANARALARPDAAREVARRAVALISS